MGDTSVFGPGMLAGPPAWRCRPPGAGHGGIAEPVSLDASYIASRARGA